MTNDYMAVEIANEVEKAMLSEGANSAYAKSCALLAQKAAMDMAYRKDAQPQIVEIFGKRVKIVEDETNTIAACYDCVFDNFCRYKLGRGSLCENAKHKSYRHFVEVDEDGKGI